MISVKLDDLLLGDKNVMIGARILGYGKDYTVQVEDPNTGEKQEETFDLTQIKDKELDEKLFKKGLNEFEFDLPANQGKDNFQTINS